MRAWLYFLVAILSLVTSVASAETIEITDDRGGLVFIYQMKWEKLAAQRDNVKIAGPCLSACTLLLGYIPRRDVCATSNASLGFHAGTFPAITAQLWKIYPEDIRSWISRHGGLTYQVIWMQAPEIFHFIHKC